MILKIHKFLAVNGILVLIVFLAFFPALFNDFIITWDDASYLFKNPLIGSLDLQNLLKIFTTPINNLYTPVTTLSFALEYHFSGFNPWVYHFNNLLLHLGVVGSIIILARNLGVSSRAAFFTGLLFAIHPIHVESVAWVSERKDCLYAFFYMLALVQYVKYVQLGRRSHFYLSLGWGLLSMLSKPMAVSLPLILLALDWLLRRPLNWASRVKEKLFYLIYLAPLAAITCNYWPFPGGKFQIGEGALIWIWSFIFCIEKFLTPWRLIPHYELPQPVLWYHPLYISAVLLFAIFLYSIYRFRRNRYYIFAWVYYFLSIFFILKVKNGITAGNSSWIGDRFMYLPSLGFCLWIGIFLDALLQTQKVILRKLIYCSFCAFFCALTIKTFFQTMIWKNDITLWSYVIRQNPDDPLAYVNRALAYERAQKYDLAIADDTKAIKINPNYYISDLAIKLPIKNDQRKEVDWTNAILSNNPYYVVALRNRGKTYQMIHKNKLALKDFNEVLRINPKDFEIYSLRIQIDKTQGIAR